MHSSPNPNPNSAVSITGIEITNYASSGNSGSTVIQTDIPKAIGNYKVQELLGKGGIGAVYKATDPKGVTVAVKILHSSSCEEERRRFSREALALHKVRNDNVVQIYETGVDENVGPFIVMEFVEGSPLATFTKNPHPDPFVALEIIRQLSCGLETIHQHGILHRDLKPRNVIVDKSFTVKILDFGISVSYLTSEQDLLTLDSDKKCFTPLWASPEQLKGEDASVQSEVYVLGLLAYNLLTGRHPIVGKEKSLGALGIATRQVLIAPKPFSADDSLSDGIERVIFSALSKNPEDRPATPNQFYMRLSQAFSRSDNLGGSPNYSLIKSRNINQSSS
jgi:serine/threonine protein kinase